MPNRLETTGRRSQNSNPITALLHVLDLRITYKVSVDIEFPAMLIGLFGLCNVKIEYML